MPPPGPDSEKEKPINTDSERERVRLPVSWSPLTRTVTVSGGGVAGHWRSGRTAAGVESVTVRREAPGLNTVTDSDIPITEHADAGMAQLLDRTIDIFGLLNA